jgi:hypothetical protein
MNKSVIYLAVGVAAVLAVALAGITAPPVHAQQPRYCFGGGPNEQCFSSQVQCRNQSPGNSGCRTNEVD